MRQWPCGANLSRACIALFETLREDINQRLQPRRRSGTHGVPRG
jgi:hypothetical protein